MQCFSVGVGAVGVRLCMRRYKKFPQVIVRFFLWGAETVMVTDLSKLIHLEIYSVHHITCKNIS